MRHRAHPCAVFEIDVEKGVRESLQRTGSEFTEFDRVEKRVSSDPHQGRLELGAEIRAYDGPSSFVVGGGLIHLVSGGGVELQGLHL